MLTIGQVASRAGLRVSAIRYYEECGLLPRAARAGGKRMYGASIVDRLAAIRLAKTAGFSLDEIRAAFSHAADAKPGSGWKAAATSKRAELDAEMRRLMLARRVLARISACSCASLEDCGRTFLEAISKKGRCGRLDR
jgi:MerR family redox-sensitive transcriptional activator SoxR